MTSEQFDSQTVIQKIQASIQENPVIVLGSGASAPHIPGMGALAKHLETNLSPEAAHVDTWKSIKDKLLAGIGLEEAFNSVQIPESLGNLIVKLSWNYLTLSDREYFNKTLVGNGEYPLTKLLRALHQTSNSYSTVITSNYDRLVEYAADQAGFEFQTGFVARHCGSLYPESLKTAPATPVGPPKILRILKPHGSLDWFIDNNSNPVFLSSPPPSGHFTPLIVAPGIDKFRRTHEDPLRSILNIADEALQNAGSIACFGYGFNDPHLHPVINRRLNSSIHHVLIVAKELSANARKLLGHKSVIAIEQLNGGSRVHLGDKGSAEMPDHILWNLDGFSNTIL